MIKSNARGVAKEKPEKVAAREMREKNVKALKEKANNYWRGKYPCLSVLS
jgi:hypothetical protein